MPSGPYQTQNGSRSLMQTDSETGDSGMPFVYLDHNATGPAAPEVVEAMLPYFSAVFANPSSAHAMGAQAAAAVRAARRQVQALLGAAAEEEIVFTSGGTEADGLALFQAALRQDGRNEAIVSAVEHPAVLNAARMLEKDFGLTVRRIGVDGQGRLDRQAYAQALSDKTALVSIMWANNETGNLYPVADLANEAHAAGALFHTDAVQAAGKMAISLRDTAIDMLSLSGHKFRGPKGIGALYVRKGLRLSPMIRGGRQERGRRAGTENVPAIVGLGKAAQMAIAGLTRDGAYVARLRDRFEAAVLAGIEGTAILGAPQNRLKGTSLIAFDGAESEVILHRLARAGICASAGSACQAGLNEPSHVLRAMHLPYTQAQGAVRFSFAAANTEDEIDRTLSVLPGIIAEARAISPFSPPETMAQ